MYIELRSENRLAVACLQKISGFRWLIVANKRNKFFKYSLFQNVKELSKSNQKWCASLTVYIKLKSENGLAVACLEKKSDFRWLIVAKKRIIFFKYSLFQNVKELSKSNQNWCASLNMYIEIKSENRLAVACLEKNQNFAC